MDVDAIQVLNDDLKELHNLDVKEEEEMVIPISGIERDIVSDTEHKIEVANEAGVEKITKDASTEDVMESPYEQEYDKIEGVMKPKKLRQDLRERLYQIN